MKKYIILMVACLIYFQHIGVKIALADDYDIYVDQKFEGDEDGSIEHPFRTIGLALSHVSSLGSKIFIKKGTYREKLSMPDGTELYGEDKDGTIIEHISGDVTLKMEKDNLINKLTIKDGEVAVFVEDGGEISDCIIKEASKKGIDIREGSDEVKIKKSIISDNGKGIYVKRGSKISITDNDIRDNDEEGIDVREKTRGIIRGNNISSNKEGGIEIIVGSSKVVISRNKLKKNKASGIATQFYSHATKKGNINIKNNKILRNRNYGLYCAAPSGGDVPHNYWVESLKLNLNIFNENRKKSISGRCNLEGT